MYRRVRSARCDSPCITLQPVLSRVPRTEKVEVNRSLQVCVQEHGALGISSDARRSSVARTCNLIFIVLDVLKPLNDLKILTNELEGFGIRLNKKPPNIVVKKREKGGVRREWPSLSIYRKLTILHYRSKSQTLCRSRISTRTRSGLSCPNIDCRVPVLRSTSQMRH